MGWGDHQTHERCRVLMKKYWSLGHRLPSCLVSPLFGDRKRFGIIVQAGDPDWLNWQDAYMDFYQNTQKQGVGNIVNEAGYRIFNSVDLAGKKVVEIGPGVLPHMRFWNGVPLHYALVDNQQALLDSSAEILAAKGIAFSCHLTDSYELPFETHQFDMVISFYSLEHLNPLHLYLTEFKRILSPNGVLLGAIPAEGGLAWGLGRYLTSRQYLRKNSSVNYDKIICWEHPNFAEKIMQMLDDEFKPVHRAYWPIGLPSVDLNLIISFAYRRGQEKHTSES